MASAPLRPTLVNRLPRALLVVLAVALIGGGAIGFATAAGDPVETFMVPGPMGGDKAIYDIEPSDADWDRQARIEVRAPEPLMLQDGIWVSAYLMRSGADSAYFSFGSGSAEKEFSSVGWQGVYIDAVTGAIVASLHPGGGGSSGGIDATPLVGGESTTETSTEMTIDYQVRRVPCGVQSALQQGPVVVGETLHMTGCSAPGLCHSDYLLCAANGDSRPSDEFRVIGMRPLEGNEALLLESDDLTMRLWYQTGVPYPVLYEYRLGSDEEVRWRMTGFTRGEEPLVPGPLPAPIVPATITDGAADRFGPALAGFEHPFPVRDAVEFAINNSQQVADFVAAHPTWFLSGASYQEDEQDGTVTGQWAFQLQGDAQQVRVVVGTPSDSPAQIPASVAKALSGLNGVADLPTSSYNGVWTFDVRESAAWPAVCQPATLPTIGSLAQRWAQMEQRQAGDANSYGFRLDCFYASDDTVAPGFEVTVGDARTIQPPSSTRGPLDPPENATTSQELRMLAVDDEGWITIETTETAVERKSWGALQEPDEAADGTEIQDSSTSVWATPSTPVAASITVVSILAGLLYWLWPALKGGAFGLFSRIEGGQLLDHPVRAELVQRIEAHPGIHYQDLVRSMGKGKGAIEHHLRKLQDGGQIKMLRSAGYTCFFPVAYDRRLAAAAPALKSDGARRILAAIRDHPGGSASAITLATGLSPAVVNHHLQRLGVAGLVDVTRNGRSLVLTATELANAALAT